MLGLLRGVAAFLLILTLAPAAAEARELTLQIQNGLVTLRARDVTVREILAEWARVGQTRVVNGERVQGGLVTLELTGVPERQALDVLLRTASGYMAAPRAVQTATTSMFDRILVLATSTAAAAPSGPPRPAPTPNIFTPQPGAAMPDTSDTGADDPPDAPADGVANPNPNPAPAMNRFFPTNGPAQRFRPAEAQAPNAPFVPAVAPAVQDADDQAETSEPVAPTAANPFGAPAGTSSRPGIVIQPPPAPTQGAPAR